MLFLLFLLVTGALIMVFGALTYEPPAPASGCCQAALPGMGLPLWHDALRDETPG